MIAMNKINNIEKNTKNFGITAIHLMKTNKQFI